MAGWWKEKAATCNEKNNIVLETANNNIIFNHWMKTQDEGADGVEFLCERKGEKLICQRRKKVY